MKKIFFPLFAGALVLAACNGNDPTDTTDSGTTITQTNTGDDDNDFVENQTWSRTVNIVWNGSSATVSGNTDSLTITNEGGYVSITTSAKNVEYVLSGSGQGQLSIYNTYKFKLNLSGLTLTCSDGPAINNQCHKTCYVVLSGTNTLADGSSYASSDEDRKAAFFSEGQLIFSGSGTLSLTGNYKHALASDDYVRVREGVLNLTAKAADGMHSNDGIIVDDGSITIQAEGDGMQCDTSSIVINGGTIDVTAGDKGMLAYGPVVVNMGTITVNSVDKGIKSAAGDITIADGTISVTTTGDDGKGILAKLGGVNIKGGTITVTTSGSDAKGIKSVSDMTISGGRIYAICNYGTSSAMYAPGFGGGPGGNPGGNPGGMGGDSGSSAPEGIESKAALTITGGEVYAFSSDDAINSGSDLTISGGLVCAHSTGNDGIDANGNCYIKGGVVYAISAGSPEVAIDANTEQQKQLYVQGGTLVAIGGLESGASLSQTCYSSNSWSKSTWYALTVGNNTFAFKTPSSGGSGLVVSGASTPTLKSGVTASGTGIFNGVGYYPASVSGGSSVSLSSYSGGNSGGNPRGW